MAKFDQKIKLLGGLLTGERAINGPFYVDFDLTERCNLHCLGCPYHNLDNKLLRAQKKVPQDMPLDAFKRICAELRDKKTQILIFQGTGEPFLYPHLCECVRTAKDLGFYVILLTNGTLLNTDIIRCLSDMELDILKISLWAVTADQYTKNYPGSNPAIYQQIQEGLKRLDNFKKEQNRVFPAIQLHYIINKTNFRSVNEMTDLAIRIGGDIVSFSPMTNLRSELDDLLLSIPHRKQLQQSLWQAKKKLASHAIRHNIEEALTRFIVGKDVWKKMPCYILWYHARIRADGSLQPCGRCTSDIDIGNAYSRSFEEIWNSPPALEFRAKTRSLEGLASFQGLCNCQYCCFVKDNTKIHRVMRWLSPISTLKRSAYDGSRKKD